MIEFNIKTTKDLNSKNAVKLVQSLTPIRSEIYINLGSRKINAKSILDILSANIKENDILYVNVINEIETPEVLSIFKNFFDKE